MISNRQQFSAGALIDGRYSIVRPIGQGGMANVYLAVDQQNSKSVALKIMKDDLMHDQEFIKRFDHEARAASSLDHPNIVKVLGYGQDGDMRYIAQEYVEGCTLKDLIRLRGALDWQQAVPLAIQIGLALEHAHRRGVVHRDIKPHNILITHDLVAKVTDFGIARAVNANTITLTSQVTFGSVHYFSPEQARGGLVSEKSDLYSLGILTYEMVTGQVPFNGDTSVAVAIKHLQEMPPLPSSICSSIPAGLDNIIMKCIQKAPENRYQDARELVDELDAFMIEPEGIYGILANRSDRDGNTTAIGLKRPNPNYGKLREIEKTINERRRSKNRDIVIMFSIIILSCVFLVSIGVWGWNKIKDTLTTQPSSAEFTVGNYIGQRLADVQTELNNAKIKFEIIPREDPVKEEGIILEQYPSAGNKIKSGDIIKLTVSGKVEYIKVLDYSGKTAEKARAELTAFGFVVSEMEQDEYSSTVAAGLVIRTMPAANEEVPKGSVISLVVSSGPQNVTMPDIVGKPYREAAQLLFASKLIFGVETNITAIDPLTGLPYVIPEDQRIIISQSVLPNTEIQVMSQINISYGTIDDWYNFQNPTPTPSPTPSITPVPTDTTAPSTSDTTAPTASETTAPTTSDTAATVSSSILPSRTRPNTVIQI